MSQQIWAGLREQVLCALATGGYYVHQVVIAMAVGKKIPGVSVAWLQRAQGRPGRGSQLYGLRGQGGGEDGCVLARPVPA